MASIENQILLISYITLAAVIAMVYGMRRIFTLERKIVRLERRIVAVHGEHHKKAAKRAGAKKAKKKMRR